MNKIAKAKLSLFVFFHLYFYFFFLWYRPYHRSSFFVDSYESMPTGGPSEVTVFMPIGDTEKSAGTITRTIYYLYTPLSYWWEKQGVGVFCVDNLALTKLFDKKDICNEK
jgi:hypothetical protein